MLTSIGSNLHNISPDSTQCQWSRLDYGRSHQDGIFCDLVREFLLSMVPPARRRLLSKQHHLLRQPRGSRACISFVKFDSATFNKSNEKLHDKKYWRMHRFIFLLDLVYYLFNLIVFYALLRRLCSDFKPLFPLGSEKSDEIRQVYICILAPWLFPLSIYQCFLLKFIDTYKLYLYLVSPSNRGFGLEEFKQVSVARSLNFTYILLYITHSLTHSPTHTAHSLTHSLSQSLTQSPSHSLTHSLTHTHPLLVTITYSNTQTHTHIFRRLQPLLEACSRSSRI